MKILIATLILAVAAVAHAAEDPATALNGTWVVESAKSGEEIAAFKGSSFTFDAEKLTVAFEGLGMKDKGTIKIDASQSPKHLDITLKGPDGKPSEMRTVYQIDGDRLTICGGSAEVSVSGEGKTIVKESVRPKAIEPAKDSNDLVLILKRK